MILASLRQNPFPTRVTIAHEVGHLIAVYRTAPTGGGAIFFYGWDRGAAATTQFSAQGVTPKNRVVIAVSGVVAQYLAGRCGCIPPQPEPLDVLLPASGPIIDEIRGDYGTVLNYAALLRPKVPIDEAIRAAVAEAISLLEGLGGGLLIAQISLSVAAYLGEDNRARWRRAVEEDQSGSYTETIFHPSLKTIAAADPSLTTGAEVLRADIQTGRARRGVPPLPG